MEGKQEVRKVRRKFTPEQKFEMRKDIERGSKSGATSSATKAAAASA